MRQLLPPGKPNNATPDVITFARKSQPVNTQSAVLPVIENVFAAPATNVPWKPRNVTDAQPFSVSTGLVPLIVIGPPSASNVTGFAAPWPGNAGIVHGPVSLAVTKKVTGAATP